MRQRIEICMELALEKRAQGHVHTANALLDNAAAYMVELHYAEKAGAL